MKITLHKPQNNNIYIFVRNMEQTVHVIRALRVGLHNNIKINCPAEHKITMFQL